MSKIDEALRPLSELYAITGEDWSMKVYVNLTEPTCPTAVISPDDWQISRYTYRGDTVEGAIIGASDMVINEVLMRHPAATFECYSGGDDALYTEWIKARMEGNDAKLPEKEKSFGHW